MNAIQRRIGRRLVILGTIGMSAGAMAATLADELARLTSIPSGELVQNLPPRTDIYPGSLLNPDLSILDAGGIDDNDLQSRGMSLRATIAPESFSTDAVWKWPFLNRFRDKIQVSAEVTDAASHAIEPGSLNERLNQSEAAKALIRRGIEPFLVDRVWQGHVRLVVSRKPNVSDQAWDEVADAARGDMDPASRRGAYSMAELSIKEGEPSFALSFNDPIVFAYSVLKARGRDTIGSNGSFATRLQSADLKRLVSSSVIETPPMAPRPWVLATVSSGWYSRMATMDQPWNSASAASAAASLSAYRPSLVRQLEATRERTLTQESTLAFVRSAVLDAKKNRARLLVLYYIGHMVTHDDDTLALLMGDAGPSRSSAAAPADLSAMGGNLADLARSMSAIQRKVAPPPGELQLSDLYDAVASGGVPFVLIVDGCLEAPDFGAFRDRLGLVIGPRQLTELYIGNGSPAAALSSFADRLRHFPDGQAFLSSWNPVILGAAPGTFAYERENPNWEWGAPVGPLASYIAMTVERSKLWPDRPPLAQLLSWSAENKLVGEINLKGTISWSDWPHLLSIRSTAP